MTLMVGMHIALPPNIFFQIYFSFERTSGVENANLILYDDDMKNGLNNDSYPYGCSSDDAHGGYF